MVNLELARTANEAMKQQVEQQKQACIDEMRKLAEIWKEERDRQYRLGEKGSLQLIIRYRPATQNKSPEASWYRLYNIQTAAGKKPRSTYLARGKSFRYPAKVFAKCENWERNFVDYIEPELARCREVFAHLLAVEKTLAKLEATIAEDPKPMFSEE